MAGSGAIPPEERIEKPEALRRFEERKAMGIPYRSGGWLDQPFIWVQEDGVIVKFLELWQAINKSPAGTSSWPSTQTSQQAQNIPDI